MTELALEFRLLIRFVLFVCIVQMSVGAALGTACLHCGVLWQVGPGWNVKVCDFGFARKVTEGKPNYMTMCGTDEWMAPEVALGERYNTMADIFSYGMVLCELITREKPPARSPGRAYSFEAAEFRKRVPSDCPPVLVDLVVCFC